LLVAVEEIFDFHADARERSADIVRDRRAEIIEPLVLLGEHEVRLGELGEELAVLLLKLSQPKEMADRRRELLRPVLALYDALMAAGIVDGGDNLRIGRTRHDEDGRVVVTKPELVNELNSVRSAELVAADDDVEILCRRETAVLFY